MHSIVSPTGGFGNHLRWLMLMSPNFNDLSKLNAPSKLQTGTIFPFDGQGKVDFIRKYVYNDDRTTFNWIQKEWKFRIQLNEVIVFYHIVKNYVFSKARKDGVPNKLIICKFTPEQSLHFYCKFMPYLNHTTVESFIKDCQFNIDLVNNLEKTDSEEIFYVNSIDLYTRELNYELYKSLVDFYQIEDSYDYANQIHRMWFDLQEKAFNQTYSVIDNISLDNFPWDFTVVDKTGEKDFDRLNKHMIIKNGYTNLLKNHSVHPGRTKIAIENLKYTYKKVTQ